MKTRREFLLALPLFVIACSSSDKKKKMTPEEVAKLQQQASEYHKQIDKNLISEGHPIAKTFKYVMDGTTESVNLSKPSRGLPPAQMLCNNCQFYKAIGDDYGSCQMLPQGNVTANGWCVAWVKQPPAMPKENS